MSQFHACIVTSRGVQVKNVETFKKDLATLNAMFEERILACISFEYHREEPFVFLSADENGDLEVQIDEVGRWWDQLPPGDWTEEQKRAHAETFGYLYYYTDFFNDTGEVKLLPFLQHHMVEGSVAVISGVSHEDGSCWYWSVAFTHDRQEWLGMSEVEKQLEDKLRKPAAAEATALEATALEATAS